MNEIALPEGFIGRLAAIVPAERFEQVMQSFTRRRAVGFRVNTLLATPEDALKSLRHQGLHPAAVAWKRDAFWLPAESREALLRSEAYERQQLYVQNLSSMVPPVVLSAQPGERVLDLTAAPGSKTLQIAGDMKREGELAAVEAVKARFFKMKDNLRRQGADTVRTYLQNGERVWRYRPEYFDRVLLDAPCSTEGRFSLSEPKTIVYWSPGKIREMARKQRRLIFSAVHTLRPGGRLVYSTCAFAPEENEAVIEHALEVFGDAIELEPIHLPIESVQPPLAAWNGHSFPGAVRHALRILPDDKMEGFFVCALKKTRSTCSIRSTRSVRSTRR